MGNRDPKSPEDWEASQHIEDARMHLQNIEKSACPEPGICRTLLNGFIWIIRHQDRSEKRENNGHKMIKAGIFEFHGYRIIHVLAVIMLLMIGYLVLAVTGFAPSYRGDSATKDELRSIVASAVLKATVEAKEASGIGGPQ